jgi:hypothetical protein
MDAVARNEIRVAIQPGPAAGSQGAAVPAAVYKKVFDAVLAALAAADREIHAKRVSSAFLISHLSVNPCEFGVVEKVRAPGPDVAPSIGLFRRCAGRVYRSDYQILLQHRRLMRAFQRIAAALNPAYGVVVRYYDTELPLDDFFRRQIDRVGLATEVKTMTDMWFSGIGISSFEGRLESIDYRGAAWSGRLTLAGGETQIQCVFNRGMGEDALNPFGNKDVSITGRAIFTGDSELPERVEIVTIEERPRATAAIDVRGAFTPTGIGTWEDGLDRFDKR